MENFVYALEEGSFLRWEAVIREEQELPLSRAHKKALNDLVSFNDDLDDRVLEINGLSRPPEPWYETFRKLASAMEVIDAERRHRLWIMDCCNVLRGIDPNDSQWEIDELYDSPAYHHDSAAHLNLTLASLLDFLRIPARERDALAEALRKRLET